ncbi:acyl-CoA dehydrogenase [Allomuricauda sp. SCSIO 65647]|uniref:acyl-CoA dehydrogenase family protein n=1 Tax=Allomuricauda sp. SCSIO 65647 TaxID=2908843 RepID=UPI001F202F65|nr:acyl-CoA dehydrogenase [Muricauda sp. SCSIO 65647]UJH68365.1 acyl-CoA dehydrogenase family protein [Muricauda sp. SCSIO 65647]
MGTTTYSEGLLPYIPFYYVIWSDDLLSASEVQVVRQAFESDESLSDDDKTILGSWLDKENPPKDGEIKKWQQLITESHVTLIESEIYPLETFSQKVAQFYGGHGKPNEQLQEIERNLGIQPNHYNHLFNVEVVHQPFSNHYDGSKIDILLNAAYENELKVFREFLEQPIFKWEILRDKEEARSKVLEQLKVLSSHGWGALAYPRAYGGKENIESYATIFEHLMYVDGSLAVKFGVQFGLFGGSVHHLGSKKHHDLYLEDTGSGKLLGCFAMTETGHGSNVRGIKTTATYVHGDRALVIHTPGKNDNKEYIGNALHATMATVFAQLIVAGKTMGVHAVLVPLRNDNHELLEGIHIDDNGHKLGLNGVDNGKIWFNQAKVPVENLLDRYGSIDQNGKYRSEIKNANKRFFTMLGTLVGGRICVAKGALAGSKMALTITTKYALKRRQFNDNIKIQEDLLIDYPSHQLRLIPKVASAYVYHIVLQRAMQDYAQSEHKDKRKIETQVAGLKATVTHFSTETIQECREACGGKGYLLENRIADLKNDTDIFTTFEGDNTVLLQLCAKGVLSDFKSELNSGGFVSVLKLLGTRISDRFATINPAYVNKVDSTHLYNHKFHLHALDFRLRRLTYTAAMRIRNYIKKGMPSYQAFLKVQTHLIELGRAYSDALAMKWYYDFVVKMDDGDHKELMYQLGALHGLSIIRKNASWYLEQGYFGSTKSKAIRQRVERLSTELRPHINALVEGFGIPDQLLTAPIAD